MQMGAWFDAVADAFHLPRPPRVSWEEAEQRIAPMLLSFMSESRRLVNERAKRELRLRLALAHPAGPARESGATLAHEADPVAVVSSRARERTAAQLTLRAAPRRLRAPAAARQAHRHPAAAVADALGAVDRLAMAVPRVTLVVVFTLGTVLMRSAGCAFNDWADRDYDAHVKRTAERPLARGEIAPWEALVVGGRARAPRVLHGRDVAPIALTVLLSVAALAIAIAYPFCKRFSRTAAGLPRASHSRSAFRWRSRRCWATSRRSAGGSLPSTSSG